MTHDPEFCRRVAEAVGLDARVLPVRRGGIETMEEFCATPTRVFRPDVDWNDAMWALNRLVGLKADDAANGVTLECGCTRDNEGGWGVTLWFREEDDRVYYDRAMVYAEHDHGPRAICEAILKLKESAPADGPHD